MKVKSESEVVQSCPTLRYPMDCSLLGSSIQGIFQARVLEWGAIAFSRKSLLVMNTRKHLRLQYFISYPKHLIYPALKMGEGNGTPLQYSCLENPMDGGAWWAAVHGVAKSQT